MSRPLLVGEHNPYNPGTDEWALYPQPRHSAGGSLCHDVLMMSEERYLEVFERVNLLATERWSVPRARDAASEIAVSGRWRAIVACGARVARAFCVDPRPFQAHKLVGGAVVYTLPHPSGRSRAWNEVGATRRARMIVASAIRRARDSRGAVIR